MRILIACTFMLFTPMSIADMPNEDRVKLEEHIAMEKCNDPDKLKRACAKSRSALDQEDRITELESQVATLTAAIEVLREEEVDIINFEELYDSAGNLVAYASDSSTCTDEACTDFIVNGVSNVLIDITHEEGSVTHIEMKSADTSIVHVENIYFDQGACAGNAYVENNDLPTMQGLFDGGYFMIWQAITSNPIASATISSEITSEGCVDFDGSDTLDVAAATASIVTYWHNEFQLVE